MAVRRSQSRDRSPRGRSLPAMPSESVKRTRADPTTLPSQKTEVDIARIDKTVGDMKTEISSAMRELASYHRSLSATVERQQHEIANLSALYQPVPPTRPVSTETGFATAAAAATPSVPVDRFGAMQSAYQETSPFVSAPQLPIQTTQQPATTSVDAGNTVSGVKLVLPDGSEILLGSSGSIGGGVQSTQVAANKVGTSGQLDALQRSDKWLPSIPTIDGSKWKTRMDEILGIETWLDSFCNWLALISEPFCTEVRFAALSPMQIERKDLSVDQSSRAAQLMAMIRTTFQSLPRAKAIWLMPNPLVKRTVLKPCEK